MSFSAFMEHALYEPGAGYYARERTAWDEQADFVTAPQVGEAFGIAVASLAAECDAALGEPAHFDLLEFGGGDGTLLRDTCDAIRDGAPALYERLRVSSIERGDASRCRQRRRLERHAPRVRWPERSDELPDSALQGLVVSNELLDAFPVHRVVSRDGGIRELFVDVGERGFIEREGPPSDAAIAAYLDRNGIELAEGQVAEICLGVRPWIGEVARVLRRGFVLTVDYGSRTSSLYDSARSQGSLVCQYRYQLGASPFERVGEQDITAHVDLGNLRRCGAEVGLEEVGIIGLAAFLVGFGAAADAGLATTETDPGEDATRRHLGLRHLLFTEIGDAHRAVLQAKGVEPIEFGLSRLS